MASMGALNTTTSLDLIYPGAREIYSRDMLRYALPNMQFMNFAVIRQDLSASPGNKVRFMLNNGLTGSPLITGGDNDDASANLSAITGDVVEIEIFENLKGTSFTHNAITTSPQDFLDEAAKALGIHYSLWGPERLLRDAAITNAGTVKYAGSASSRATLVSTDILSAKLIRDAVEALESADAPRFNVNGQQFYICMLHPHQVRAMREDPDFVAASNYHQTRAPFTGEVGMFEGVVFISSTAMPYGGAASTSLSWYNTNGSAAGTANALAAATHGGAVNAYAGCIFGDSYLAFAMQDGVEFRDNGIQHFGRLHQIAWYQCYGAGVLIPSYGVRIETA